MELWNAPPQQKVRYVFTAQSAKMWLTWGVIGGARAPTSPH